jgi:hypothetical protein
VSVAEDPEAFEELWWGRRLSGLRVHLGSADPIRVEELLTEAWLRKAPRKLAAMLDTRRDEGRPHT